MQGFDAHDSSAQHRRAIAASSFGQPEELIFFGQGAELAYAMGEGGEDSAEERIKTLLGSDPGERGLAAARRRVVRRPLGSSGYQAQTIVFSERDRGDALSSEPLSELLQLAASRKGQLPRCCRDSGAPHAATSPSPARASDNLARPCPPLLLRVAASSTTPSVLQTLTGHLTASAAEAERLNRRHGVAGEPKPEQLIRGAFVQELLLSMLAAPAESLDGGPLDGPLPEGVPLAPAWPAS